MSNKTTAAMSNPFEPINARLTNLEALTLETLQILRNSKTARSSSDAHELITPEELCKRLDISKPTAWAWEKKGIIKGHHLGNRKYFIWQKIVDALTKGKEVAA